MYPDPQTHILFFGSDGSLEPARTLQWSGYAESQDSRNEAMIVSEIGGGVSVIAMDELSRLVQRDYDVYGSETRAVTLQELNVISPYNQIRAGQLSDGTLVVLSDFGVVRTFDPSTGELLLRSTRLSAPEADYTASTYRGAHLSLTVLEGDHILVCYGWRRQLIPITVFLVSY